MVIQEESCSSAGGSVKKALKRFHLTEDKTIGDQLRLILPISGGHSSNLPMRLLCPSILPIGSGHPSIVPTGGGCSSIVPIR